MYNSAQDAALIGFRLSREGTRTLPALYHGVPIYDLSTRHHYSLGVHLYVVAFANETNLLQGDTRQLNS
jgi:hypothetical protein